MDKPSILIVDDEDNIRAALARWFSIRGFEVEQATDGADAIEKFGAGNFDVITMDLEMPRMGGLDALREIRKRDKDIPVVIVTGFSRDTEVAIESGADKVLLKPLHLRDLEMEVRQVIRGDND